MAWVSASRALAFAAVLLLISNLLYSRKRTYPTVTHAAPASAAPMAMTTPQIANTATSQPVVVNVGMPTKLSPPPPLPPPPPAAVSVDSGGATTAVAAVPAQPCEAGLVEVPDGENMPAQLRAMCKGSDLFVSFSSASMAPFALNWIANLRRAGLLQVLVGALDEKMQVICKEQGIAALPIQGESIAKRSSANLRFDYGAYKRMAALKVSSSACSP